MADTGCGGAVTLTSICSRMRLSAGGDFFLSLFEVERRCEMH